MNYSRRNLKKLQEVTPILRSFHMFQQILMPMVLFIHIIQLVRGTIELLPLKKLQSVTNYFMQLPHGTTHFDSHNATY